MQKQREEFERWAYPKGYVLTKNKLNIYVHYKTYGAFEAWQARQPEIDALKHDNADLYDSLNRETRERIRLDDENAALVKERDELLAALRKIVQWNDKYASHRIYSHHRIIEIADELDVICDEARTMIAKYKEE